MKKGKAVWASILILSGVGFAVLWFVLQRHYRLEETRIREETRMVDEAQAAVEKIFREEKQEADDNQGAPVKYNKEVTSNRNAIVEKFGVLQSITGNGYLHPAWNIQGYHYLTAHRTANFSKGAIPLKIYVTEGRVTAPGKAVVYVRPWIEYDTANHMSIFVSHPDLVQP
ncbi:MAG TPA: hypothetical protein VK395_30525 [Gemmataceae bacterium]|nr:hypothetical protein [Gemmataceae bacterium]